MKTKLEEFINLDRSFQTTVRIGDERILEVCGRGDVKIDSDTNKCIKNAQYVPNLDSNLLSVGQFVREGYSLVF